MIYFPMFVYLFLIAFMFAFSEARIYHRNKNADVYEWAKWLERQIWK